MEREQEMKEGDLMSEVMSSHSYIAQWVASARLDCRVLWVRSHTGQLLCSSADAVDMNLPCVVDTQ